MRRPVHPCSLVVAAAALVVSSTAAHRRTVSGPEEQLFRLVNGAPDRFHLPIWAVMQSGSLGAVFAVSGVLRRSGRVRGAWASLLAGITVWAGVKAIKPLVGRGRPACHLDAVTIRGQQQSGLGYPSGHAAVATTLAIVAASPLPPGGRLVAAAVAAATGGARVYVGAHLPLDVVGGAAVGVLAGRAATVHLTSGRSP